MTRKRLIIPLAIAVLLILILKPTRRFFSAFFEVLFAKEVIVYDKVPISNDTVFKIIRTGVFESNQYLIKFNDSLQTGLDKHTNKTWNYKIKWIHENEYYSYDSTNKFLLKNKIIDLTDTSFTLIYSKGKIGKEIKMKIKTAPNSR